MIDEIGGANDPNATGPASSPRTRVAHSHRAMRVIVVVTVKSWTLRASATARAKTRESSWIDVRVAKLIGELERGQNTRWQVVPFLLVSL